MEKTGKTTISKEKTAEIVKKLGKNSQDCGSSEVQVGILSTHISHLTEHLKVFKKDNSARAGLMKMVGQRRRLLNYIKNTSESNYLKLIDQLGLRK